MKTVKNMGKRWIQKGVIGVLIGILTVTPISGITLADNATASPTNADTEVETSNIIEVDSVKELKNNITNNEVDALVIDGEKKKVLKSPIVQEYLDDGVNVFVEGDCKDEVNEAFDKETGDHHGDNEKILGYYLSSNGEDMNYVAVSALSYDTGKETINSFNDVGVSSEEIVENIESMDESPVFDKLPQKTLNILQAGLDSSAKYMSAKSLVYVFGHGWRDCDQGCVDTRKKIANSDWFRIGTFDLICNVYNAGNIGNKAYDFVYSKAKVTPVSKEYSPTSKYHYAVKVDSFELKNTILNNKDNVRIFDATRLTGSKVTKTVNFAGGISSSNVSINGGLSYSFAQNGARIVNSQADLDVYGWKSKPFDSADKDDCFEIAPTIEVETRNRKENIASVRIRMTDAILQAAGFWIGCNRYETRPRYFKFTTANNKNYLTMKFKNHKSIAQEEHNGVN